MKKYLPIILFIFFTYHAFSQEFLPQEMTPNEELLMDTYLQKFSDRSTSNPPNFPVRTMAEWEEIKALVLSWQGYTGILTEIVREAVSEVEVVILCSSPSSVQNTLLSAGVNTNEVTYINQATNSIWIRDYGQHTVYSDKVGNQVLIDWIYNRPRPLDDDSPSIIANYFNYDLYSTTTGNYQLVNTGGNFMSDGMGTAFASKLILEENDGYGPYSSVYYPNHSEDQIDNILNEFMGIERYIKMETLPYDGIHHIDMHMKLINEETLLIAEYPSGVADGPQIEENIEYILENFLTPYGNPYEIIRIPSPPSTSGIYPDNGGYYRTYTNSVFINNKVLVPFYRTEYDTIAQRIYEEALPGYEIIGIDCDNSGNNIISASGAIHCITKAVGVDEPLLINHAPIRNMNFVSTINFQASASHISGISSMELFYKMESDASYTSLSMTFIGDDVFSCDVQGLGVNEKILYYFKAQANNGKLIYRPIVAPYGSFNFKMTSNFPTSQNISLNPGWNLISSYIQSNQTIDQVFDLGDNLIIVKDYIGNAYLPDWDFNGIGDFNSLEGYFVKVINSTNLNISGVFLIPEENPIILNSGWKTISYLRLDEVSATLIFQDLVAQENLIIVKNFEGQAYLPEWDFNGIGNMKPGQGYLLKVYESDQLNYLPINETY